MALNRIGTLSTMSLVLAVAAGRGHDPSWLDQVSRNLFPGSIRVQPDSPLPQSREIVITGVDYAFRLTDSILAGPTVIRFNNVGKVSHELSMYLLRPGKSVQDVLDATKLGAEAIRCSRGWWES